jgi:pimeloyl-ACP methyl ester carboxylesterase
MDTLTSTDRRTVEPRHRTDREGSGRQRSRSSHWLPVVAVVALALYPLIALVLFPEGSGSLASRLVASALICGAVAAAIAIARRAPASIRGTAMLMVGFVGIAVTGGVVAKRVVAGIGVREVAGILFAVASVTLVVIGWRRTLHGIHRMWLRIAVAVIGSLLVAQFALLPAVFALDVTNRVRPQESGRTPADVGLAYRDVRITTPDDVWLAAWWIPSRNGAAVLVLPGAGSTRDDVLNHAALLAREGYGALLLDWRGHGASEGRLNEFGWGADADVRTAVTWVLRQPDVRGGVGLLGLSMGGEVAITAAASDPRVAAVVAEGVSVRTLEDARQRPNEWAIPLANDAVMFGLVRLLGPASPPEALTDAFRGMGTRPVLLIAGDDPPEAELGPVYAAAAPASVTLWSLPDTGHTKALSFHPDGYRTRVLSVFDAALLAS